MTINEQNYDGANVTVVGRAGGPAQTKQFQNGGSVAELSIAVSKGYKRDGEWVDTGTDWYTLTASPDYAQNNWPTVEKGDKVRVDGGRLEAREYQKRDGSAGIGLTIRYGNLSVVQRKNSGNEPF